MCGIAGFQGDFPPTLVSAMTRTLARRGPDGEGTVVLGARGQRATGLGHRRLSIIDLSSAGAQPMTVSPDRGGGMREGLTLIYNGEIYNYRELRAELVAEGHNFRSDSDSEVLLHLYERDGFAMLSRLNGIFAFAIHDARDSGRPEGVEQGALFLARDHMGVKPLYYAQHRNGFVFASEIKALLCDPGVAREVDPVALHEMLAYLWTPAPRTMLTSVRKLEPGTALLVSDGRVHRKWSFYSIPYAGIRDSRSADDLATELHDRVAKAVERQLIADVPVGAFLSGGLDSSAVVAMMRKAWPDRPITCFTIAFEEGVAMDGQASDLPYARRAARHIGVDLEEVTVKPSAIDRLPEMVDLLDEPQADPAPINALLIAERARAMGIPVLLSGAGGDDLFSGYRRHRALAFERWWSWAPVSVRRALQTGAAAIASGDVRSDVGVFRRRVAKTFSHASESPERRLVSYFWWSTELQRRSLYTADFGRQLAAADTAAPLLASLQRIPLEHDPLQRMLYLEARHFLADHNLNYTDRAGMAAGVEIRVPLLDIDLVEFATRVPSGFKQKRSVGKAIFKQAMEPSLPRDIIYRPKSGFGAPLRRWLREELRELVDDTLAEPVLKRRSYFDPRAVQRLVQQDRAGQVDGSYTIFALLCFELWCRRFIDR
jgi:asparagine synthase (glutamine-hydrolysing)